MNTASIKKFILLTGDIIILYLALFLTLYIRYGSGWQNEWPKHFASFTIIYIFALIIFYIIGLYELAFARNNLFFFLTLSKAIAVYAIIAVGFFYFIPYFGIAPKTNLFINLVLLTALFAAWREIYNHSIKTQALLNNVLVLGQSEETKELIQFIKDNPQMGYKIKRMADIDEVKILSDLIDLLMKEKIQIVVTAIKPRNNPDLVKNLYQCIPLKIIVTDIPAFYEKITGKIPISAIEEMWFLENLMVDRKVFFEILKRATDIVISLILGIFSLLLTPFIALAIKLDSPGTVFYKQKRVGQDNRIFEVLKFRTMVKDAEKNGAQWAKEKDNRITKTGKYLRKIRLDELPQAWNVLKGEMSFVGPRPERPEFAFSNELLSQIPFYQVRHNIKPGLTGWAQIKYPYGASIKETTQKLQYDLFYIKNRSVSLDLAIVLKTIKIILSGGGR